MARFLTFLLGVALGAAAGFAAGLVAVPSADVPDDLVSGAAEPSSQSPGTGVRDDAPHERRAETRSRRSGADPIVSLDPGDFGKAETGTGVLSGRVVDSAGKPLDGVTVRALPSGDPPEEHLAPTTDPEENLRRDVRALVRRYRWNRLWEQGTKTSASGTYRIEALAERDWRIEVEKEGWKFERADTERSWADVRPGATVDWIGSLRLDLELKVLLPDGRPAEDAKIESRRRESPDSYSSESWNPASPRVDLGPGAWRLSAYSGEYSEFGSEDVPVEIVDGQPPAPLTIRLQERPGVLAEVGAAGPEGPMKVRVRLVREGPAEEATRGRRSRRHGGETDTWVEPSDHAAFLDLKPGRYALVASVRGSGEFHRETVEVAERLIRRAIAIPAGDLRDWIAVSLVAPDGSPVQRTSFSGGYEGEDGSGSGDVEAARLPDGRWRVAHFDPGSGSGSWSQSGNADPEKATKRWVEASSDLWGRARAEYRIGTDRDVTLRFTAPARLDVTVSDAEEYDSNELVVEIATAQDVEGQEGFSNTKEAVEGHALFGPLPVREFVVSLKLRDEHWRRTEVGRTRVALVAGENRVSFSIPALQTLRVALAADVETSSLSLRQVLEGGATSWIEALSSEPGSMTWARLPPGRYRLVHDELGEMTLSLPGPGDVRFVPKPWNAVRFNVGDEDDPVHAAGFRDGDVGVSIDGTAFEMPRQIAALFAAAQLKAKSRVTVLRGTQRIDLDVDLSKLADSLGWDLATR